MLQPGKRCTTNGRKYCVCVLVDQRFEVRTPEIRNREFVENSVAADRGEDKLLRCLTETLFQNRWRRFDLKEEKGLMLSRNFCIVLEKSPEALSGYIIFLDVDDHVLRVCVDGCLVLVARQSNRGGKSCSRRTGRGMRHSGLEYCTDGLAESFERFLSGKLRQVFCLTVERSLLGKISRSAPVLSKKMLQRTLAQFLGNKENLIGLTTLIREETLAELVGKTECGSSHNPKLCRNCLSSVPTCPGSDLPGFRPGPRSGPGEFVGPCVPPGEGADAFHASQEIASPLFRHRPGRALSFRHDDPPR